MFEKINPGTFNIILMISGKIELEKAISVIVNYEMIEFRLVSLKSTKEKS